MSFGYSISDIVLLGQLAWKAYKSCRDAPESFKNISHEVLSLHAPLKEVEENLSVQTLSSTRQAHLKTIRDGCRDVLEELQSLVDNTTQVAVEKKLDKLLQEFQDGKREGSVVSTQTVESISTDEKQTWRIIRKELEDIGITVAAFDANKDFIMNWFKVAVATGAFEEQIQEDASSSQTGQSARAEALHMQVTQKVPQKALTRKERIPRVTALIAWAWAFRYDEELINAACQGHEVVVQRLLEKGADVNAKGRSRRTVLHQAALNGHEAVVQLLLEKGADFNAKDRSGRTVLHGAANKGHEMVARMLLEKGANANTKNKYGRTALHYAVDEGHGTVAQLLLEKGADINAEDTYNKGTALHLAANKGLAAVVWLLLEKGANANAKSSCGRTALHYAADGGYEAVVWLLLEKGANANVRDEDGLTALYLAVDKRHEAIVQLLKPYTLLPL